MNLTRFLRDDDAVSPVIGIILVVAITVILAAVIGAYALTFGASGSAQPTVQWDSETNGSGSGPSADFLHGGGDTVDRPTETLEMHPEGAAPVTPRLADADGDGDLEVNEYLYSDGYAASDGDEVDLVWVEGDDSSTIVFTHTVET